MVDFATTAPPPTAAGVRPTDAQVIALRDDLEMIQRPHLWPEHPILFLTRGPVDWQTSPLTDYGIMIDRPDCRTTVWRGLAGVSWLELITYPSFQAIIDAGWIVD